MVGFLPLQGAYWVDIIVDLMTFASLLLAVVALYQSKRVREETNRLKRQALLRIRGPKLLKQLDDVSADLNDELSSSSPDLLELSATMNRAGELVKSLDEKFDDAPTTSREDILMLTANSNRSTDVKRDAKKVYARLAGFITLAKGKLEDQRSELS